MDNSTHLISKKTFLFAFFMLCFSLFFSVPAFADSFKYAVQLYGIGINEYESGDKAALTFGPAMDGNYIFDSKYHSTYGTTEKGNYHRCIHEDSWETIAEWANEDPYVYEQCVTEKCTHSVLIDGDATGLNLPGVPDDVLEIYKRDSLSDGYETFEDFTSDVMAIIFVGGDGPSVLKCELMPDGSEDLLRWFIYSSRWDPSEYTSEYGWGASQIRAFLNGIDSLTMTANNYGDRSI